VAQGEHTNWPRWSLCGDYLMGKIKCWFEIHNWKRISEPYFLRQDDFGHTKLVVAVECEDCGKRTFEGYHGCHEGNRMKAEDIWKEIEGGKYTGD